MRESGCACEAQSLYACSAHPTTSSGWKKHKGFWWAQVTIALLRERHTTALMLGSAFKAKGNCMILILQDPRGWLLVKNQAPKLYRRESSDHHWCLSNLVLSRKDFWSALLPCLPSPMTESSALLPNWAAWVLLPWQATVAETSHNLSQAVKIQHLHHTLKSDSGKFYLTSKTSVNLVPVSASIRMAFGGFSWITVV